MEFIPIHEHTAEYLKEAVVHFLERNEIDISNCRGQSYDNASNMAGLIGGLQAKISEMNKLAIYVPCGAHSLNLVGKNAVAKNATAAAFFEFVERLYHFFVYSTFRWEKLKSALSKKDEFVLKRATGTRWSAKYNAIHVLNSSYSIVTKVLTELLCDDTQTSEN